MTTDQTNQSVPTTNAVTPTAADMDDLSLFTGIRDEAQEYREEQQRRENRAPVSYVDAGSYWLRLYPELHVEDDGQRRLVMFRRIWSYTGLAKGVRRLPAPKGDADTVRPIVNRLRDAKIADAWRYFASEEGLIKVCVFQSSLPPNHKYIKLNTPMVLVMRRKQIAALAEFIADLSPEDLRRVLNPNIKAPMIKMSYTAGSGGSSSFGFDIHEAELPPLPPQFPSLYDVLLTDQTPLATPDELLKISKSIDMVIAASTNILNPTAGQQSGAAPIHVSAADRKAEARSGVAAALAGQPATAPASQPVAAQQAAAPASQPVAAQQATATALPECPGAKADPALAFGRHNPDNVNCIVCPIEDKCRVYTAKQDQIPF